MIRNTEYSERNVCRIQCPQMIDMKDVTQW